MIDVTPQERLALLAIALLITSGSVARHLLGRESHADLNFAAVAADTINGGSSGSLRALVTEGIADAAARSAPLKDGEQIDPNRAGPEELDRLPGIGPATAQQIVSHRELTGGFATMDDLLEVPGVGRATLDRIQPFLRISGRNPTIAPDRPVNLNVADEADLTRLPGIGPALAQRILEYREENGRFRTWEDLEKVSGIGPSLRGRLEGVARLGS